MTTICRRLPPPSGPCEPEPESGVPVRLGRAGLPAAAEVSEAELAEWEAYRLVAPDPEGGYDTEAVHIARPVSDLGRYGLEPRQLRAVKADREADLVEQVVDPLCRHRNPQTRAHAEATVREPAALLVSLHGDLLRTAVTERLH
ncbi:hypothetical protein GCM10020367_09730 [Streptomyces sannanensis]|uniref:Uncharacterized protein n=1 Tax=Streptomyces sannanensis TaxID=285536 RepID=A0ABP6S5Y1_9ACTN